MCGPGGLAEGHQPQSTSSAHATTTKYKPTRGGTGLEKLPSMQAQAQIHGMLKQNRNEVRMGLSSAVTHHCLQDVGSPED